MLDKATSPLVPAGSAQVDMACDDRRAVDFYPDGLTRSIMQAFHSNSLPALSDRLGADTATVEGFQQLVDLPSIAVSDVRSRGQPVIRLLHHCKDVFVPGLGRVATVCG